MSDIPGLLRRYWLVCAAVILGGGIIVGASLAASEAALMWIGGGVGIGIGGTIVASDRRSRPKPVAPQARRRRR